MYKLAHIDKAITKKALKLASHDDLVKIFGELDDYEIKNYVDISHISNKAVYKLNDDEFFYLKARETLAYEPLKAFYTQKARNALGFDFNRRIGVHPEKKINDFDLKKFEDSCFDQTKHIPLDQKVFDKIMSAEKFPLPISTRRREGAKRLNRYVKYYACMIEGYIVPIALVRRKLDAKDSAASKISDTLSVFFLLRGRVPFFAARLDFKPGNTHANKLSESQEVTRAKTTAKGTHMHCYSEKFAVLFPSIKKVMHSEAKNLNELTTFKMAEDYVKSEFNFKDMENEKINSCFNFTLPTKQETPDEKLSKILKNMPTDELDLNF